LYVLHQEFYLMWQTGALEYVCCNVGLDLPLRARNFGPRRKG
jgi:hypothetical protein